MPRNVGQTVAAGAAMAVVSVGSTSGQGVDELPHGLLDQHAAYPVCVPLEELPHADDIRIHALDERYTLYMIPCLVRGENYAHAIYAGRQYVDVYPRLLFVDYPPGAGWVGTQYLFGAEFDEETLTLTSLYAARPTADCGTSGAWVWDRVGFRLEAFYVQYPCDFSIEPGDFPRIWPSDD